MLSSAACREADAECYHPAHDGAAQIAHRAGVVAVAAIATVAQVACEGAPINFSLFAQSGSHRPSPTIRSSRCRSPPCI